MALSKGTVRIVGHVSEETRERFNSLAKKKGLSTALYIAEIIGEKLADSQEAA